MLTIVLCIWDDMMVREGLLARVSTCYIMYFVYIKIKIKIVQGVWFFEIFFLRLNNGCQKRSAVGCVSKLEKALKALNRVSKIDLPNQ